MYKDVLRAIAGIDVFPVVSLLIFVAVFAVTSLRALRIDRREVERAAALPLEGDSREAQV